MLSFHRIWGSCVLLVPTSLGYARGILWHSNGCATGLISRAALGVRLYNHPAANLDLVRPGLPPNLREHALTVRVNAESSAEGFVQAALGGRLYNHPAADLDLVRPGLPPNLREDVRSRSE